MAEIIYSPEINLFAFHLFRTPQLDGEEDLNGTLLWDKFHQVIFDKFYIDKKLNLKDPKPNNQRFELLNSSDISLPINTKIEHQGELWELEGFVYPLQLYDSYGLGFSLGFPEPKPQELKATNTSILEEFNPDSCLLPDSINSDLGQTLIITAWLDKQQQQLDHKSLKNLSDECLRAFVPKEKRPLFHREGDLFGSPIFEYGLIRSEGIYRHVLVWLFKSPETYDKFYDAYNSLLDLFFYRSKVIREFQNSRDTYKVIYQEFEAIEQSVGEIFRGLSSENILNSQDLRLLKNKLKELTKKSVEYTKLLRDLEFRRNSIFIHSDNYNTKLQIIREELELSEPEALAFLEQFSNEYCQTFQAQIQADLSYFVQGTSLLERAIDSIRGIVEIDQAERDRQLQSSISSAGAAITVGGIIASSSGQVTQQNPISLSGEKVHPFTWFVLLSILAAFISGVIGWYLPKLFKYWSKN
ncbi:MAG: hypothetical protein AB4060_15440 [Crocosphaera sp.]